MRFFRKVYSEQRVRRELDRHDGTWTVELSGVVSSAWNPQPESAMQRLVTGTALYGPCTITYTRDDHGHIRARLSR